MQSINNYSKNDLEYASHGQEGSAAHDSRVGVMVGGYYGTALGTLDPGDFGQLRVDNQSNLMVNLAAGEEINIGTLNLGTINKLLAGTITKVEGGSIVMTVGTIAAGTMVMIQPFTTSTVANTIDVAGSSGTTANTLNGMMKGVTIVTGGLTGTGTATVQLKDATGGTIFTQAVTEAASPVYYGSVVPLNTGMSWISTADGTQDVAATVNLAVHYQK